MAASNDSNDDSDIFWPGYVDAISNLAINLLFVIAVMAIVVISATMQINDLLKRKDRALTDEVSLSVMETKDTLTGPGKTTPKSSANTESQQKNVQQEAQNKALQQQLDTVQKQLSEAKAALEKAQSPSGSAAKKIEGVTGSESESGRVEIVASSNANTQAPAGNNAALVVSGGVIVPFDANAIELNPAVVPGVIEKMGSFAPVKTSKWRITVIVPKGFSEAKRLGFYRANALRNALLQNGVSGDNIEVKTLESNQPSADNTRVIIRPAP